MKPLETSSCTSPTFHSLYSPPLSHAPPPPFPALGEDEELEFARMCFSAAAWALRWIEGICMGWGGESKRCEGEQESMRERCYCWGRANEGCGGGRRDGEGNRGAHSHWSDNSPVLCPEDRRCRLLAAWVRRNKGALIYTCSRLHPHPLLLLCSSLQPSLSGAAEDRQPGQTKHTISAGRASVPLSASPSCYDSPLAHERQNALTGTRSDNFLLHTHSYIPLPLSVRRVLLISLSSVGLYFFCSSSAAAEAAAAGRVHSRALVTGDHTAASTTEGKSSFFTFSSLSRFSVSLTFRRSPSSLSLLSVCPGDSHGGHAHLQPCHLLPGVRTPGAAHASQWVASRMSVWAIATVSVSPPAPPHS